MSGAGGAGAGAGSNGAAIRVSVEDAIAADPSLAQHAEHWVEESLPLIDIRQEEDATAGRRIHTFHVGERAAAVLQHIPAPVSVVAVVGQGRTGKSYLASRLVNRSRAFKTGGTNEAVTMGIFMWGTPQIAEIGGRRVFVITLDCEGFTGGSNKDHDTRIFAMATLMCSMLVYNQKKAIDEPAIEAIGCIAKISEHLKASSSGTTVELAPFFPSLMWVVRDAQLRMVDKVGLLAAGCGGAGSLSLPCGVYPRMAGVSRPTSF